MATGAAPLAFEFYFIENSFYYDAGQAIPPQKREKKKAT